MALSPPQKAYARHKVNQEIAKLEGRVAMSDAEWSRTMGFHVNTAVNYKKNAEVKALVEAEVKQAKESKDYFRSVMRRVALEELWTNYEKAVAKSAEKRHYLKLILDETSDVEEAKECVDYASLSDEDLEALIFGKNTSLLAKTQAELMAIRAEMKGEACSTTLESSSSPDSLEPPSSEPTSIEVDSLEDGLPEIDLGKSQANRRLRSKKKTSPSRSRRKSS